MQRSSAEFVTSAMPDWSFELAVNSASWFINNRTTTTNSQSSVTTKVMNHNSGNSTSTTQTQQAVEEYPLNTIVNRTASDSSIDNQELHYTEGFESDAVQESSVSFLPNSSTILTHLAPSEDSSHALAITENDWTSTGLGCSYSTNYMTSSNIQGCLPQDFLSQGASQNSYQYHQVRQHSPSPVNQIMAAPSVSNPPIIATFRASGLRFVLRCSFQIMLLAVAVTNLLSQLAAQQMIRNEFKHRLCFYAFYAIVADGALFSFHFVVAVAAFSCYLRKLRRLKTVCDVQQSNKQPQLKQQPQFLMTNGALYSRNRTVKNCTKQAIKSQSLSPVNHLATASSVLTLLHHILCDLQFALFYAGITFIPASKSREESISALEVFGRSASMFNMDNIQNIESSTLKQLGEQREFALGNKTFTFALALTVLEVILHWCQSWVVYLWKKPCCYFAEKFPLHERDLYNEAGVIKGVQIFILPLVSLLIFATGAATLFQERKTEATFAFIVSLFLSTLISVPFLLALSLILFYFVLRATLSFLLAAYRLLQLWILPFGSTTSEI
ncbi:uncharacterized protein LOC142354272 isoform X2 [Convolutriloba macropyga]|uniref:uncharacterized protein LOC142354272 isoform X2 n=1 Tax=Convolutriloba macropyga TaxID=536237 RepID=UPI003F51C3C8